MKKWMTYLAGCGALCFMCASAAFAAGDPYLSNPDAAAAGYDLAVAMNNVDNSRDSYSIGHMTIMRGSKKLLRSFELFTKEIGENKEEEHVLFSFFEPAEVKGTMYLEWTYEGLDKEDDLWVFLPSESMVRRINSSSKFSSFMRSDFTNEDLENMDDVEEYTYLLRGSEVVDGIDCYILDRIPKEGKKTQYSKHIQWVRKDNLLRYKVEYYDKKGKMLKTMMFPTCELIDGIWSATTTTLERADGKSRTEVVWDKMRYNVGLDDAMFEHSHLQR